jgi:hypothetical protein
MAVDFWTDVDLYEPTCVLRRFGIGDVLEQQWRKAKIGRLGHVEGFYYEWRPVPHVYGEPKSE